MMTPLPPTNNAPTLLWFRQDLRLEDNAALLAAVERGKSIIPVFIWSPEEEKPWPPGAAARWWLHQSLEKLQVALAKRGSNLVLRWGPTGTALEMLIHETHAGAIYWNRRYEPSVVERDSNLKDALRRAGIAVQSFRGNLLFEPWTVKKQGGQPFRVFTPFSNSCMRQRLSFSPRSLPPQLLPPAHWPHSEGLDSLRLQPSIYWAGGLRDTWEPGEIGAHRRLADFLRTGLRSYKSERDRPDHSGTSMLSPHLHFGEINPAKIWHAVQEETGARKESIGEPFLRQLLWREFAYHLLFHFPETQTKPMRQEYSGFPFRHS